MSNFHIYSDTAEKGELPNILPNPKLTDPRLYIPSKGLQAAVNVALNLEKPLLITGEPGTGKTELAKHIAYYFGLGNVEVFNAQTTSQARDLFYRYDALAHFQFSQTFKGDIKAEDAAERFIRYHGLGKAIKEARKAVVLLDEIDKAPRDLPNDILAAIDELAFEVPETGKRYTTAPKNRPIIVMTSNSEKNLPDAFLRRVVYYHIEFPNTATLQRILAAKIGGDTEGGISTDKPVATAVATYQASDLAKLIAHFEEIRSGKTVKMRKNPATAELINWVSILLQMGFPAKKLDDELTAAEQEMLLSSYSVLAKNRDDLRDIRKMVV